LCQEDGNCVSATFIEPLWQVKSINKNEMRPLSIESPTIPKDLWQKHLSIEKAKLAQNKKDTEPG
jgi:hypothetical protein